MYSSTISPDRQLYMMDDFGDTSHRVEASCCRTSLLWCVLVSAAVVAGAGGTTLFLVARGDAMASHSQHPLVEEVPQAPAAATVARPSEPSDNDSTLRLDDTRSTLQRIETAHRETRQAVAKGNKRITESYASIENGLHALEQQSVHLREEMDRTTPTLEKLLVLGQASSTKLDNTIQAPSPHCSPRHHVRIHPSTLSAAV